MSEKIHGEITKKNETRVHEMKIEWKITNFISVIDNTVFYKSPDFHFVNDLWYFRFKNIPSVFSEMSVQICPTTKREYLVEYSFGIKKGDGSVVEFFELNAAGTLTGDKMYADISALNTRSRVLQRQSEFLPSGNFTIICRLKCEIVPSVKPTVLEKRKLEKLEKLDSLSENFKNLFANKRSCDVTLHVKDKEYTAHRAVLIARSPVFAAMFEHKSSEKQTGIITISDCDPDSFQEFLQFLYCGKLHELSFISAFNLYMTSNKYEMLELKKFCEECLIESLSADNVCDVVIIADKYDDSNLMSAAQDFFNKNLDEIFDTTEWRSLMKDHCRLANKLLKEMSSKMKVVPR